MGSVRSKRLIVGITGATGSIFGIRLLEKLKELDVKTHLVVSQWGLQTLMHETELDQAKLTSLASKNYPIKDMSADIASGSYLTDGMVIVPCSMGTLSAIATGACNNLIHRAADVIMKEKRRLVIVPRETPLSSIHLENMLKLSNMGVTILPPVPAFYNQPKSLNDMVDHIVMRIIDQFGIEQQDAHRWDGTMTNHLKK